MNSTGTAGTETDDTTLYLGLCMAGAVSAGAYTAGVVDYLLEALEEWEKRRDPNHPDHLNTPKHRVVIPVIGGASAGGMTGMMMAAAMNNPHTPVNKVRHQILEQRQENKFYHSWVDMVQEDMFSRLLDTSDIRRGHVRSLLNSSFIDELADRALVTDANQWINSPYFYKDLKLFVTLSNLEGFSYNLSFLTNVPEAANYVIKRHSDFACFRVSNTSDAATYHGDGWAPLCFRSGENLPLAKSAAMATGAFPLGLQARAVSRQRDHIHQLLWSRLGELDYVPQLDPYQSVNVDGGLMNNEPFERVEELLKEVLLQENITHKNTFDAFRSTVLMIDPFPSTSKAFTSDDHLLSVLGKTFTAMTGQLRIKPEHVAEALSRDNPGKFLIAPKRNVPQPGEAAQTTEHGGRALASGFLGGFGGFLHKEFRVHDFYLGRANCERFLRHHFTVPLKDEASRNEKLIITPETLPHEILRKGYEGLQNPQQFCGQNGMQLIPLFTKEQDSFYMPRFAHGLDWPLRRTAEIQRYKPAISKRLDHLIMNMTHLSRKDRFLLWGGKVLFLKPKLTRWVMQSILEEMQQHRRLL